MSIESKDKDGDRIDKLFVKVHARIVCDGDSALMTYPQRGFLTNRLRENTTVKYLQDSWQTHGGWE